TPSPSSSGSWNSPGPPRETPLRHERLRRYVVGPPGDLPAALARLVQVPHRPGRPPPGGLCRAGPPRVVHPPRPRVQPLLELSDHLLDRLRVVAQDRLEEPHLRAEGGHGRV